MELYNFYKAAMILSTLFTKQENLMPIYGIIGAIIIWIAAFLFQGVGVSTMAKKRGLKKTWLAFVPFVNIWYIGKIAGECQFFGQRVKRIGMYAMIAQIIATVFTILTIGAEMYLWLRHGAPQMQTQLGIPYWTGLSGFSATVLKFYDLSGYLFSLFQLICEIVLVLLLMGLYRQYEPKNYIALTLLTALVPISRFFILFALRNRKPIDYNAYMRARQEAFMRRRQQYYNPYNSPYGNPYNQPNNSYGGGQYGQNAGGSAQKPEEPFSEFSSSAQTGNASKTDKDSDGFFD